MFHEFDRVVICWILICICPLTDGFFNHEVSLYNKLFHTGYNPKIRPKADSSKPIEVELEYELITIGDLDEIEQVLNTLGFVVAIWYDDFLKWDPEDYGGVEHMVVPPKDVWLPDIIVENSADTFYHSTFTTDFRVDIKHTGRIIWAYGGNFATSCTLDMAFFPFDIQKCDIVIENWAYLIEAVDLKNATSDVHLQDFSENGEWSLDRTSVAVSKYSEDTHPGKYFPRVTFSIYMSRKPLYYFINLVTPCIFCITIAMLVFWLPPESGEKVSLGVTVLLAFSVFQLVVADNTPKTSDFTPMLSLLMAVIMGMATFSVMTSIFVLYLFHHSTTTRPPKWLRKIFFQGIARVLCMRALVPDDNAIEPMDDNIEVQSVDHEKNIKNLPQGEASEIRQILDLLKEMNTRITDKEKDASVEGEWRAIAFLVDRCFFWLVLIICLVVVPIFLVRRDPSYELSSAPPE